MIKECSHAATPRQHLSAGILNVPEVEWQAFGGCPRIPPNSGIHLIVRFLTRDDDAQYLIARAIFEQESVYIPESVLLETAWVLRAVYQFPVPSVVESFRKLLGLPNVHLDDEMKIARVLDWHEQGLDFADAMDLANSQSQATLLTLDEKFISRASGISTCQVKKP